jgi:hypothetical protein
VVVLRRMPSFVLGTLLQGLKKSCLWNFTSICFPSKLIIDHFHDEVYQIKPNDLLTVTITQCTLNINRLS